MLTGNGAFTDTRMLTAKSLRGAVAAASAGRAVAGTARATAAMTAAPSFRSCRRGLLNVTFIVLLHIVIVLFVFA